MKVNFRISRSLLETIRRDLRRPHAFAFERVGFISAGLSGAGNDVLVLAQEYRAVRDEDYLPDQSVGAMIGPEAIRVALQWALGTGLGVFHVHKHEGRGVPRFSGVDLRENQRFVPDFFKVAPQSIHGAILLSDTAACGQVWINQNLTPQLFNCFTESGIPIQKWSAK